MDPGTLANAMAAGGGVLRRAIHAGPGYRVYFGMDGNIVVILLCGGDKSTQTADIRRAQTYWADYLE